MIYEDRSEATPREAMALKATVEPMLIMESKIVTKSEIITAFKGMFHPGFTYRGDMSPSGSVRREEVCLRMKGMQSMAYRHLGRRQRAGEMRWLRC